MSPLSAANSHDKKEGRPEKHPKRAREKKTSALASHFVPAYCLETPMALMVVCCGTPSYWYGRVLNSWETAKLQRPGRAQKKKSLVKVWSRGALNGSFAGIPRRSLPYSLLLSRIEYPAQLSVQERTTQVYLRTAVVPTLSRQKQRHMYNTFWEEGVCSHFQRTARRLMEHTLQSSWLTRAPSLSGPDKMGGLLSLWSDLSPAPNKGRRKHIGSSVNGKVWYDM